MPGRLVAIDAAGGDDFVAQLRRIWDRGDAAAPIDLRLPAAARRQVLDTMRVGAEVGDDDALVMATSGSTGAPKGVVLTHEAVAASARATSRRLRVTEDDHWLACLPLSHVGGLSVVTRALHAGTRLTVLPEFDAAAVDASPATLISLVPTALRRIDPTRWRAIVLGGSHAPADRPPNTVTTYGMTESGSGVVYDGVPLEGVDVRVADSGEIELRGPMLLRCYRDGTDPKDPDGWYPTGDLGTWEDGRLRVAGRAGDMIVTGGENVWPEAVEAVLHSHPAVADVLVRGVDDEEWGQVVEALVVPSPAATPTLEELRGHVKDTHPAFMAPRRLQLVDAIPRTGLGKPRRA